MAPRRLDAPPSQQAALRRQLRQAKASHPVTLIATPVAFNGATQPWAGFVPDRAFTPSRDRSSRPMSEAELDGSRTSSLPACDVAQVLCVRNSANQAQGPQGLGPPVLFSYSPSSFVGGPVFALDVSCGWCAQSDISRLRLRRTFRGTRSCLLRPLGLILATPHPKPTCLV